VTWSVGAGLEGRGIIVTGAAGGIGRAVTAAFATTGARILVTDREQEPLDALIAGFEGSGHIAIAADLRDLSTHAGIIGAARAAFGDVYALVNLAAVARRQYSLDEITEDDWDLQHDINLKAAFFLCRAAGQAMIAQGHGGRIVTFTSQAWWTGGFAGSTVYASTKGGVATFTRGLARSMAPHGITVNSVSPGLVNTPMITEDMDPAAFEGMARQIPLGYIAEPEDLAGSVVFLVSDHARYITGATLNVSGGFLMY
jgi:NAD(P)-dependent dehydrogenase (short-subunit alcohol dehydrogenase family)